MKNPFQLFCLFFCFIYIPHLTLAQKIEKDQTSYSTGARLVITDITSFDSNLIFMVGATKENDLSPFRFSVQIRIISKADNGRFIEKGDNMFIAFKNGGIYQAKYSDNAQKGGIIMTVHVHISKDDWISMGFNDGTGSQITEFRIEDTTGLKIYSFPISELGSNKFYRYALAISERVLK